MRLKSFFVSLVIYVFSISLISFSDTNETYYYDTGSKYTYLEMIYDLDTISRQYSDMVKISSLATTEDGRELYHIYIGDEDATEHYLVTASIHAREYITTPLVMKQTVEFLRRLSEDSSILPSNKALHIVPMVNPDGVALSQFGLEAMNYSSTRQQIYSIADMDGYTDLDSYLKRWKSNARGVDLNRNFNARWDEYISVNHPSSDHYKGTEYESEIESKALVDLTRAYDFKRTISYHTQGEVIYWYFAQIGELESSSRAFAESISRDTGYYIDSDYTKLDPAGYKDWALSEMGIPSITIEVGTGTSPVSPSQFDTIYDQNKNVFYSLVS